MMFNVYLSDNDQFVRLNPSDYTVCPGCAQKTNRRLRKYLKRDHDGDLYMAVCEADVDYVANFVMNCPNRSKLRAILQNETCHGSNVLERSFVPTIDAYERSPSNCKQIMKLLIQHCDLPAIQVAFQRLCTDRRQLIDLMEEAIKLCGDCVLTNYDNRFDNNRFLLWHERGSAICYDPLLLAVQNYNHKVVTRLSRHPSIHINRLTSATGNDRRTGIKFKHTFEPVVFQAIQQNHSGMMYFRGRPINKEYDARVLRTLLDCAELDINLHNGYGTLLSVAMVIDAMTRRGRAEGDREMAPIANANVRLILQHHNVDIHTIPRFSP